MWKRAALIGLVLAGGMSVSACYDDGYGYGGGVAVGYGDTWDPYYGGGFSADPYWGNYIYDRNNHRRRWDGSTRNYWQGRAQPWHGANRDMRPVWRDYGGNRPGGGAPGGRPGGGGRRR
jgi:hypothetical protein